ncbi:proclotting enzyme-like [Tropilaelaps mercedesae]|uniref:Proclotting enzyme-like n=1 Tax=Tropilaelaps mercedesae TaxID=418985 RepID=A0A1V9X9K2_9ACAR|nr:proclotting enzyme-like [Tropilaelaps mercedesae]
MFCRQAEVFHVAYRILVVAVTISSTWAQDGGGGAALTDLENTLSTSPQGEYQTTSIGHMAGTSGKPNAKTRGSRQVLVELPHQMRRLRQIVQAVGSKPPEASMAFVSSSRQPGDRRVTCLRSTESAGDFAKCEANNVRPHPGRWQFPAENDEECQSPVNEVGVCMTVRRCAGLLKVRDINHLRRFICGFEGKTPLLCCPYSYQKTTSDSGESSPPNPIRGQPQLSGQSAEQESALNTTHTWLVVYPNDRPFIKYPNRRPERPTTMPAFPHIGVLPILPQRPIRPPHSQGALNKPQLQPPRLPAKPSKPPPSPPPTPTSDPTSSIVGRPPKPGFLPQICGFSNASLSRVVGGTEAQPAAWPWMAAIYIHNNRLYTHVCGGALVSNKHVVTAAHCVRSGARQQTLPASIFVVRLGDHDLQTTSDLPLGVTLDVAVAGIRRHPAFNPRTYLNDIAIMLLGAEVPFSWYIQPVCLPYEAVPDDIVGHHGFVTGWGYTKYGKGLLKVLWLFFF